MATSTVGEVMQQLETCLGADGQVLAGKRWKFVTEFRLEAQDAHEELAAANEDIPGGESNRRTASEQLKQDYPVAEQIIHAVYNRVKGLSLTGNSLPLLVAYGFEAGKLGEFDQSRVQKFLGQFKATSADFANEASPNHNADAVLPADWIVQIGALKTRITTNELLSAVGTRADLVELRNQKRLAAEDILSRIWHYLAYALPQRDQDPLMTNYGFTPRREPTAKEPTKTPVTPPATPSP